MGLLTTSRFVGLSVYLAGGPSFRHRSCRLFICQGETRKHKSVPDIFRILDRKANWHSSLREEAGSKHTDSIC